MLARCSPTDKLTSVKGGRDQGTLRWPDRESIRQEDLHPLGFHISDEQLRLILNPKP